MIEIERSVLEQAILMLYRASHPGFTFAEVNGVIDKLQNARDSANALKRDIAFVESNRDNGEESASG